MATTADEFLVRAINVSHRFDERWALRNLTLNVAPGDIHVVLGHNGAGKSTLFRLLQQQLAPTEGRVELSPLLLDERGRRRMGVLAESNGLCPSFSAWENLELAARIFNVQGDIWRPLARDLLARVDLDKRLDDPVAKFSAGMKRKVALIRSFIHSPNLIILDEPTAGLDAAAKYEIRTLIQGLGNPFRSVLIATQDLWEAERIATRLTILRQGRILYDGNYAELSKSVNRRKFRISRRLGFQDYSAALPPEVQIKLAEPDEYGMTVTLSRTVGEWPGLMESHEVMEVPLNLEEIYLEIARMAGEPNEN